MNVEQSKVEPANARYPYLAWLALVAILVGSSWQAGAAEAAVNHSEATAIVFANVISADPIVELVREPAGREVCYDAPRPRTSKAPVVLGGILGGLVGNQFGSGSGRTATTIAGAAVGATLGANHARNNTDRYRGQRQCEAGNEYREYERVSGYRVTYEYEGQTYVTQTDERPGAQLAIEIESAGS